MPEFSDIDAALCRKKHTPEHTTKRTPNNPVLFLSTWEPASRAKQRHPVTGAVVQCLEPEPDYLLTPLGA